MCMQAGSLTTTTTATTATTAAGPQTTTVRYPLTPLLHYNFPGINTVHRETSGKRLSLASSSADNTTQKLGGILETDVHN